MLKSEQKFKMSDKPPAFTSSAEEVQYWKLKAEEAKQELEEFQEGSRELEQELESQLEQTENKMKELKSLTNK